MAPTKKKAPAAKATSGTTEPITVSVVKRYTEDGSLNVDTNEVIDVVKFPEGVEAARVAVLLGTSAEYGAVKASVTVSVPTTLEEIDDASTYAYTKASEYLDQISQVTGDATGEDDGEDEDEPETKAKSKAKKADKAPAKGKKAAEPEDDDDDDDDDDADDDDAEDGDDDDGIDAEDIMAMNRKQLDAFVDEYADQGDELDDLDRDSFKKNASGLEEYKAAVIEALGLGEDADDDSDDDDADDADEDAEDDADADGDDDAEDGDDDDDAEDGYTEEELADYSVKDLKAIYKEWRMGKFPEGKSEKATRALAIKAILKKQEQGE